MITLNTPMCGATANFPESVQATLAEQVIVFDYTPDQAGWSGPGIGFEGYLPREPQYKGMYEIFGYMPNDWYFFDGLNWWNDCALMDGSLPWSFSFNGILFAPETVPVVRTGTVYRSAARETQRAPSSVTLSAPAGAGGSARSAVRLAVDRLPAHAAFVIRPAVRAPVLEGFGAPILDAMQDNMVCVWKLDEADGTRRDVISGEDLSPHNAPGATTGRDGSACLLANSAANGLYREQSRLGPLGACEADTEIVFSTWLYANTVGYRSVAGFIDEMGGMGPWSLALGYQNRLYVNINTHNWNDNAYAQTASLSAGQWYHVAFTFSAAGHLRLYLNGTLTATADTYSGAGGLAEPYSPFTLGCGQVYDFENDTTTYGNSWDGLIDETCIWNAVPADPDAFAAALWNTGRGAFYRVDSTQRTTNAVNMAVHQRHAVLRRERSSVVSELVATGSVGRFDAVARYVREQKAAHPDARGHAQDRRVDAFESLFSADRVCSLTSHRAAARRIFLASTASPERPDARHRTALGSPRRLDALADTVVAAVGHRLASVVRLCYRQAVCREDARASQVVGTVLPIVALGDGETVQAHSGVCACARRDLAAVCRAATSPPLAARGAATAVDLATLRAYVLRTHCVHAERADAEAELVLTQSVAVCAGRCATAWTCRVRGTVRGSERGVFVHISSGRGRTTERASVGLAARGRQDALDPVSLVCRGIHREHASGHHDAFLPTGWLLVATNAATGQTLDLGFVIAGETDVVLPDGDWQIEARPSGGFWQDCRTRTITSVSVRDGRLLHAGLPAILNLRGEIRNGRRLVRWEVAGELLPNDLQFGVWTAPASPVDTAVLPAAILSAVPGQGSYLYAFVQTAPLYVAVAALRGTKTRPVAELFLDWATTSPASPANQLAD